jgi:hypothetical protein
MVDVTKTTLNKAPQALDVLANGPMDEDQTVSRVDLC